MVSRLFATPETEIAALCIRKARKDSSRACPGVMKRDANSDCGCICTGVVSVFTMHNPREILHFVQNDNCFR